ncbi:MAG: zinc ribbon domain-containing protein [Candidatus Methanomethylophilaceae archaeon]|nr:zinc ribbon domain-containing protein [Candidatus Methanomethylophilaceae archaeon]
MYCPNCGYELDSDDEYCPNCSSMVERGRAGLDDYRPDRRDVPYVYEEAPIPASRRTDNASLAMLVSVILPGIGAVIAGNSKGLAVFAMSVVALAVACTSIVLMPFCVSVMIVLWIIGLSMTVTATTVPDEGSPS